MLPCNCCPAKKRSCILELHPILMQSDNIDHPKRLKDDKYLSRIGFSIFLSAIRLQLFGMLPKYKQPHITLATVLGDIWSIQ